MAPNTQNGTLVGKEESSTSKDGDREEKVDAKLKRVPGHHGAAIEIKILGE